MPSDGVAGAVALNWERVGRPVLVVVAGHCLGASINQPAARPRTAAPLLAWKCSSESSSSRPALTEMTDSDSGREEDTPSEKHAARGQSLRENCRTRTVRSRFPACRGHLDLEFLERGQRSREFLRFLFRPNEAQAPRAAILERSGASKTKRKAFYLKADISVGFPAKADSSARTTRLHRSERPRKADTLTRIRGHSSRESTNATR